MNKDALITGLVIVVAGGVTYKALKELRYHKLQKEMYEQVGVIDDEQ